MAITTSRTPGRSRIGFWAIVAAAALLALSQLSCATLSTPGENLSMPAARAGLRPEYRVFYDELGDYGDWVLIEPYGFVFRPRTRFQNWSPYYDGFWAPSDSYGWIWVSGEPYGWATYHYGRWVKDDYQDWVWIPGLEWAPAWVSWSATDQYVGWAALGPSNGPSTTPFGSGYHFVARGDLGTTDLRSRMLPAEQAAKAARAAQPVENYDEVDRVTVNRGPRIEWVEQVAGPLTRAKVEDIAPLGRDKLAAPAAEERPKASATSATPAARPKTDLQRSTEAEARKVRTIMQQKQPPPEVIPRFTPVAPAPKSEPAPKSAPADTAR